jgi:CHAT domain-containing protein
LSSGIILATPQMLGHEDGVLQVWEILEQIQLDSDLVVLSACESGVGAEEGAEGLNSLARAFQIAGARTVLASSWRVSDDIAADLMVKFYKHLEAGQSKDVSLQAAQVELSQGTHPLTSSENELVDTSDPFFGRPFRCTVIGVKTPMLSGARVSSSSYSHARNSLNLFDID